MDTRTDVYSLGVILYELLSGRLPYEVNPHQLPEAVQRIREEEPTSLSSITRNFRGDIETIARKALEKDKTRRYSSAADLGTDIQHYLNDEPVAARPPSASYQLKKFARRHRGLVAGVAAVFFVLLAGVAVSTSQAIRANRERDRAIGAEARAVQERNRALAEKQRADGESATSRAVSDFLQNDLLAQAGSSAQARPRIKPDPNLKVRTALDRAAAGIAQKFEQQPLVEASIRTFAVRRYVHSVCNLPQCAPAMAGAPEARSRMITLVRPLDSDEPAKSRSSTVTVSSRPPTLTRLSSSSRAQPPTSIPVGISTKLKRFSAVTPTCRLRPMILRARKVRAYW